LETATTPSLEALKAYSTAMQVSFSTGFPEALPHLKRAVEIDPQFAMAYAFMGLMYSNIGESVLSLESTRNAYQLRDHASDRERFFIRTLYERNVTGNLEKEQQTLRLWGQTYPRDRDAHGLLAGFASEGTGQYERRSRRQISRSGSIRISVPGMSISPGPIFFSIAWRKRRKPSG
jgi:eukaryotic-like serine/threonine-protein kinase